MKTLSWKRAIRHVIVLINTKINNMILSHN